MLQDGQEVPNFELPGDDGQPIHLANFKGRPLVIYFYPKDGTSGCTAQAKEFSSLAAEFAEAGVEVVGISPDSAKSHQKFKTKYELPFRLAADEQKQAALAYGVWVEKTMYGRKYMGVERSTFLVDTTGRLVKSWSNVKVPGHAEEVLDAVRVLQNGAMHKPKL